MSQKTTALHLSDGSRRTKTVDGVTTTYHYNNGLLLSQSTGDETLHFYYDSTGKVVSIGYQKGTAAEVGYFFARNAQGDIIAVYRSSDSALIGTYEYDLWGRPVNTTEASAGIDTNGILTKNPFRYRGYYFDNETGFYYLQSRYYDSAIRRFISADTYISTGQGLNGHNKFAYCGSNPINRMDPSGKSWVVIIVKVIVTAVLSVGALSLTACDMRTDSGAARYLAEKEDVVVGETPYDAYNCYGNAILKQERTWPVGYYQGASTRETFGYVQKELGVNNVEEVDLDTYTVGENEYLVALKCGKTDFHFARLDENGWYYKCGTAQGLYVSQSYIEGEKWYSMWIDEKGKTVYGDTCYDDDTIYFVIKEGWDE